MWICSYGVVNCTVCRRDEPAACIEIADGDRIYFRIPYADKEEAKRRGARWDPDQRMWYSTLRNPNLSAIAKQWRFARARAQAPATYPPQAAARLPVTRRQPPGQLSLESLLNEPEPVPGSIPYEEFMAAIRAADAAEAEERAAKQQVHQHLPLQNKGTSR